MLNLTNNNINNSRFIFFYSIILTFLFVSIFYYLDLIVKVAPSDPLQYVGPAINPKNGFPFLDRIVLWYFIRFISLFGVSNEYLGGVATLTQTSILLFIILFWLGKKINFLSVSVFFFTFLLCEYWIGLATYTYPTQLLALVTIGSLLVTDLVKSNKTKYFILGCASVCAVFTKIQGFAFLIVVFYLIFTTKNRLQTFTYYFAGVLFFLLSFIFLIYIVDGAQIFHKLFKQYFNTENFSAQFKGRGLVGYPNFLNFFDDPTLFIGFIFSILSLFFKKFYNLRQLAILAFSQIFFLYFIYFITKRGGPLITNYFIESITIFLIFFTIFLSIVIKNLLFKLNYDKDFSIGIILVFFGFLIFIINFYYLSEIISITKIMLSAITTLNFEYIFFILTILLLLILTILLSFDLKKIVNFFLLIIFFLFFIVSNNHAIKKTKWRLDWTEAYYKIANIVKFNLKSKGSKIIIHTKLNRSNFDDAERRLRRVLFSILRLNQDYYYSNVCKGLECNISTNDLIIITDDSKFIEYLKKKNFKSDILIQKENNLTLNNSVYLLLK